MSATHLLDGHLHHHILCFVELVGHGEFVPNLLRPHRAHPRKCLVRHNQRASLCVDRVECKHHLRRIRTQGLRCRIFRLGRPLGVFHRLWYGSSSMVRVLRQSVVDTSTGIKHATRQDSCLLDPYRHHQLFLHPPDRSDANGTDRS